MSDAKGGPVLSGWKLSLLAGIVGVLIGGLAGAVLGAQRSCHPTPEHPSPEHP